MGKDRQTDNDARKMLWITGNGKVNQRRCKDRVHSLLIRLPKPAFSKAMS